MRITFQEKGGVAFFPGLNKPVTLDDKQLTAEDLDELRRLIAAAHFFDLRSPLGSAAPGAADYKTYEITIDEEGGRSHRVQLIEPVTDQSVAALLNFIRKKARGLR